MMEHTADVVEQCADVDTAIDEVGVRCLDVGHDEMVVPCAKPGTADVIPWPKMIEHGQLGGVNCTTRNWSFVAKSASSRQPKRPPSRPCVP